MVAISPISPSPTDIGDVGASDIPDDNEINTTETGGLGKTATITVVLLTKNVGGCS